MFPSSLARTLPVCFWLAPALSRGGSASSTWPCPCPSAEAPHWASRWMLHTEHTTTSMSDYLDPSGSLGEKHFSMPRNVLLNFEFLPPPSEDAMPPMGTSFSTSVHTEGHRS